VSETPLFRTRAFHTNVARRVTMLLLCCALVPLGALAWMTLHRTTHELDVQARAQMHHDVKAIAMNGVDQLAVVSDKLRLFGLTVLSGATPVDAARTIFGDDQMPLAFENSDGEFKTIRGELRRPVLKPDQIAHLDRTGTLLTTDHSPNAPGHILLVSVATQGKRATAFCAIDRRTLWNLDDDLLPASSTLCVFRGQRLLACSHDVSSTLIPSIIALPANDGGTINDDLDVFEAQTWRVPLGYSYGSEPLMLAMIRSQAAVRAPLQRFVRDFWLVLALAMLIVTLLSVAQVRRSLKPLDQLVTGTGRLARRDFDTRIDINTRDEFQELGDAINGLATELKRQFEALDAFNLGTLAALARAIDAKSPWTAGHSERVTAIAVALGQIMEFSDEQLTDLQRGGLVHDIGKLATPSSILNKPGPLTPEERRIIQEHPARGASILQPIGAYARLLPIVSQHHERWDGSGYPRGLKGEEIDLAARVMAVADTFDAITSDRPYRAGLPLQEAISIITTQSGKQFAPDVVAAFCRLMDSSIPLHETDERIPA
jgi:putative nucleotidyltransferase with HDIG domain